MLNGGLAAEAGAASHIGELEDELKVLRQQNRRLQV
jgi:hypothetical protein